MRKLRRATGVGIILLTCVFPSIWFRAASAQPAPVSKSLLRVSMPETSLSVDPALVVDEQNSQFASLLYSGLVRLDSNYHVVNDTAARIVLSKDRKTYTFYLRKDARFSNGDPVTAADFRYSIQRSLNPALKSPSASTYLLDIAGAYDYVTGKAKYVSGIKVVNARTLRITTRWAVPYFLMELTFPTSYALPSRRLSKLGSIDSTSWYSNPIGSGPYKIKSLTSSKVELVPNPYYVRTRPTIRTITISLAALPDTGLYQYLTHGVDVVNLPRYDRTLLRQPGIRETPMLAINGIFMNFHKKPFGKKSVRRALTYALYRAGLVSAAMGGSVTPFSGNVPAGQPGYDSHLKPLQYSPDMARSALKAAGYPNGKGFLSTTLYFPDDPAVAKLAKGIVTAWQSVLHITVATHALTLNTLVADLQANKLPLYLIGWPADYPDPHDWLSLQWETGALNNNVRYHNARFDQLVQAADVTWSPSRRMQLYHQAQQVLVDDAAWIPMYTPHRLVYMRPNVVNLFVTGYGIMPKTGSWASVQLRKSSPSSPHHQVALEGL